MSFKVVSWNVNGIRACVKKGLLAFLEDEKPDVFLAQELKAFKDQCPEVANEVSGYFDYWNSAERPGYSGVGSFFKEKPKSIQTGMGIEMFDREGRIHLIDLGSVYLINSYFPNGAASDERHFFKMRYLDRFLRWIKDLNQVKPVILAGDINIAHREQDIHDPVRLDGTSGFKPEEREWMDSLFSNGFIDAYRILYPDLEDQYSWWSYRAGARPRNKGWRIDYFILSEKLDREIQDVRMLKNIEGSDHCPIVLELKSLS